MKRLLLALTLMMCCSPVLAQPAQRVADDRPDVLFITIDDLNDWVGCLGGHPQTLTPNIDRLAQRGVLFTNAHCQAPVCLASRTSFMSGMQPSSTGMYLLGSGLRESPRLAEAVMLPQWFGQQGYTTLGTGKLFHGGAGQDMFDAYGPGSFAGPYPMNEDGNGRRKLNYPQGHPAWDWGVFPERDDQTHDYQVTSWAVEQISQEREGPTFLAVGIFRPHVPLYVPQQWYDMQAPLDEIVLPQVLDNDRADIPDYGRRLTAGLTAPLHSWFIDHDQWAIAVQAYLASITYADAQVGRLLDALDASGRADNTIIILLSDHGFHLGEKQRWAKRSLWEESTRVPLIIAGPAIEPGRSCTQPAGLIDLYPTLGELLGAEVPGNLEGESLVPQLADVTAARGPAITTWWVGNHAVRSERYRYIRYADGSQEFYDHDTDPNEWHNLAADAGYAQLIAEHRAHLPTVNYPALPSNNNLDCAPVDRAMFGVRR